MAGGMENLITRTRKLAGVARAQEQNDRQLLAQFTGGDEAAFTALVDRYGGLVLGVCQRILHHAQDSEDAFQATFLVLARKAGKVAWEESVSNWLHGVACRIAFQVRRERLRHGARDLADFATPPAADTSWSDLKPVLDEELDRLPARYRIPLVLCCLEGKSRDEAAAQLGWSVGSVKGRLERARELLRSRLARRGVALSAALAATLLSPGGAQAAVPLALGLDTVRAGMAMLAGQTSGIVSTHALTLAQGALHTMFIAKVKCAAAVVLAMLTLGLGTGYVTHQALADISNVQLAAQPEQKKDNNQNDDGQQNQKDDGQQNQKLTAAPYVPDLAEFLGEREQRKEAPSIQGFVKSIDAKKIQVIVARNEPDGQTFDLAKDVKVVQREGRDTKDAKLADVKERTRVTLMLDDAKKIVKTIVIVVPGAREGGDGKERPREDGRTFRGFVGAIDKTTITFEMGGRDKPATTKTFDLAKEVKVTIRTGRNVKNGKVADVQPKTWIQVRLDENKKVIQEIEINISTTVVGAVSEIDEKSITLVWGREEVKSATYPLAKDVKAQYWLPGTGEGRDKAGQARTLKLAEVAAKLQVTLQLDDDLKVVQSINVQLPQMRGAIGDIDVKKGTFSVKGPRADELKLTMDKDARILIEGKAGALDKVAAGAEVIVILSPDRLRVLSLQTPIPERREE